MAFPTVAATNTSNVSLSTTHVVSLPASISAGDLLMVFFLVHEDPSVTTPDGWTLLKSITDGYADHKLYVFYKVASGSEGASVTITIGTARRSAGISFRITGHSGAPEVSTGATGMNYNPDPDALTPSGGAKDYLWIALCKNGTAEAPIAYPTNYTGNNLWKASNNGTDYPPVLAVATRELNASSENPGTFETHYEGTWTAITIAVSPVATPANTTNFFQLL